jgi:hypothetical protein
MISKYLVLCIVWGVMRIHKSLYMFSTDATFISNIFDLKLAESMDVETAAIEGQL